MLARGGRLSCCIGRTLTAPVLHIPVAWISMVNKDGLLCRCFKSLDGSSSNLQLVVPRQLHREVLQELHEGATGGYLGEEKTLKRLK